jgi:hypothetical protein
MMTSDMAQATSQFGVQRRPRLTLEAIDYKTGGKPVLTFNKTKLRYRNQNARHPLRDR